MACNRFSVGSLASLSSFSSGITGVDTSFISMASTLSTVSSSYEIESEVGREAVKEICCSALSRILDFPDDQLEVLLGYDEDDQEATKESGVNVARYEAFVCLYVRIAIVYPIARKILRIAVKFKRLLQIIFHLTHAFVGGVVNKHLQIIIISAFTHSFTEFTDFWATEISSYIP